MAILVTILVSRFKFLEASVPNVSAVTIEQNLGVYWNQKCTRSVYSIDWGVLSPGEVKEVVVYVKNEGNESVVLRLRPLNWNPENASRSLSFTWNSEDKKLEVGQVARVAQTLTVDPQVTGISNFSFDIVVEAWEYFVGDINRDGSVNGLDFALLANAFGATPTDSNWTPEADLNKDNAINMLDFALYSQNYGKS